MLLLALAVFAAIDVPLQRHHAAERLKMSHQELKQEHKEVEGNAEVKAQGPARACARWPSGACWPRCRRPTWW